MYPDSDDPRSTYLPGAGGESPAPPPRGSWVEVRYPGEKPVVVYALLGFTVFVFFLQLVGPTIFTNLDPLTAMIVRLTGQDPVAAWGMKVNELIQRGQIWRLLTPVFLHGSILHVGFNMYALMALGPELERHYGHGRFLALYLLSGFAGNVVSFLFSNAPSLGSSTAIFGLLGAEGVFLYRNRELFGESSRRALTNIIVIAAINLVIGLSPGIDNWGHLGGLACGIMFAWFAGPVLKVSGTYPVLSLEDEHDTGDALLAGFAVFAIFAALAVIGIFFGV